MTLLPSECPNCGRLYQGCDFNKTPGPVQIELRSLEEQLEATSISTEALLVAERDGLREQLESLQFALRLIEVGPTTAETRDALRGVLYPAKSPESA